MTYQPGLREEFRRRCRLRFTRLSEIGYFRRLRFLVGSRTGSCVGAAAGPWPCFLFSHVESRLLLICEDSKGDQLHGSGTGLPQVRDLVSRIALLLFDVSLAHFFLLF